MNENVFAPERPEQVQPVNQPKQSKRKGYSSALPDYSEPPKGLGFTLVSYLIGFVIGFVVLFVYYKMIPLSVIGGLVVGVVFIFTRRKSAVEKRKLALRTQFLDMLEAMSVALRAGNPLAKALESAREDLLLTYSEQADIVVELDAIIKKFASAVPLSEGFSDFAARSGLEDVASFASIYATIEGKSGRADEIVRETQKIISDKMAIEMEIETMMTAAKTEVNVMQFMPLVILLVIGYAGGGFMNAIYTTAIGRVVATVGLLIFFASYAMARKYCKVQL